MKYLSIKYTFFSFFPFVLLLLFSFNPKKSLISSAGPASPLATYSVEWNDAKYLGCNTAANVRYMNADEKEVIYILNMARKNPGLFASSVVKQYPDKSGQGYIRNSGYYKSLLSGLQKQKPMQSLIPDSLCYESAFCHAQITGKGGIVGHYRNAECQKKQYFNGECCDYGHNKPLDVLMAFFIDDGIASLGHRKICLDSYKKIGVSIQPHASYGHTAVLDFIY